MIVFKYNFVEKWVNSCATEILKCVLAVSKINVDVHVLCKEGIGCFLSGSSGDDH